MDTSNNMSIRKGAAVFLQIIIAVLGVGILAFMLVEPNLEGRNANASLFEVYFKDAFLAYAYLAAIPFFVALWEARKVAGFAGRNLLSSEAAARSLRRMKNCAKIVLAFILGAEAYLFLFQRSKDDIAGGVFMGLLAIVAIGTIAIVATRLERRARNAIGLRSKTA